MAEIQEKDINIVKRRLASISNHLIPLHSIPTSSSSSSSVRLCNAASINDSYHRIHGQVSTHQVEWKIASDDDSEKDFTDIIYKKAVGEGIAKCFSPPNGWGAALTEDYSRKADVDLRGYSGYNTRWALFLLDHIFPLNDVTSSPPVATTIFFGANDAAIPERTSGRQHVPIQEYGDNLRKIVNHLKECSPSMLVVLITPPPIDEEGRLEYARSLYPEVIMELPERTNEVAGLYANKCLEVAKDLGLPSIDLWSKMQEPEGWQKKYLSDGLHLTGQGNAVVHQEVTKIFNEAGFRASEMPFDFPHHPEIDEKNPEKAFQLQ